jgi:transmembrane sensor
MRSRCKTVPAWVMHITGWHPRASYRIVMPAQRPPSDDHSPAVSLDPSLEAALDWFLRLKRADITESERQAFADWQAADATHANAYRTIVAMWGSPEFTAAVARQDRKHPVAGVAHPAPRSVKLGGAIAACVLLAVGVMTLPEIRIALKSDHRTGTGQRERVSLSDGSTALLNSGSAMAVRFSGAVREVELLRGETYVEVTKDAQRPFELLGGAAVARVLGTAFSLRLESDGTVVTVRHGEVAVHRSGRTDSEIHLHAGDQVLVTAEEIESLRRVDEAEAFAWTGGRLQFHNRPLGDVLAELDRYHAGLIFVANPQLKTVNVSGNYRLDDPGAAVASLADATNATLTRLSDYLLILR